MKKDLCSLSRRLIFLLLVVIILAVCFVLTETFYLLIFMQNIQNLRCSFIRICGLIIKHTLVWVFRMPTLLCKFWNCTENQYLIILLLRNSIGICGAIKQ